jgi:hypothetical protein
MSRRFDTLPGTEHRLFSDCEAEVLTLYSGRVIVGLWENSGKAVTAICPRSLGLQTPKYRNTVLQYHAATNTCLSVAAYGAVFILYL